MKMLIVLALALLSVFYVATLTADQMIELAKKRTEIGRAK